MNRSLSLTPSITYALDRAMTGSRAPAPTDRAAMSCPRYGADLLGLAIFFLMLGSYLLA